jgi:hypothetical protein
MELASLCVRAQRTARGADAQASHASAARRCAHERPVLDVAEHVAGASCTTALMVSARP